MVKNGVIRIVEAVIAVMIVIGVLIYTISDRKIEERKDLTEIIPPLLEEIAQNYSLRAKILTDEGNAIFEVENFLKKRINNPSLDYGVEICDLDDLCPLEPFPTEITGEVYTEDRVISTYYSQSNFAPKKIKIFIWRAE